jgi:site-specific recombinase XerD
LLAESGTINWVDNFHDSAWSFYETTDVQAEFKATRVAARLPDMRLQDLRHAAATFLIAQGLPLRLLTMVLGRSTISLTANTYGHIERE